MIFVSWPLDSVQLFVLLLIRCLGLVGAAPVFGGVQVPVQAKLSLGLALAALLFPLALSHPGDFPVIGNWYQMLGLGVQEALLGLFIGFMAQLVFFAVQFAGQLVGMQMGFGIVGVLDPDSGQQVSIISQMQYMLAIVLFLLINGHHLVLQALWQSVEILPIGHAHLDGLLMQEGIRQSARVLTLGVQLASPILAALLLSEVAMGIIARTVPQMNIFIVGFPVKIGLGIFMLVMLLPMLSQWLQQETLHTAALLDALVRRLAG